MIIDSHTHAWEFWPYEPPVPDHGSRGRPEQLLWEMDRNGVDKAVLICAGIEHNPSNNDFIARSVEAYPDRLIQFADVDCSWSDTYHTPGAADRLANAAEKYHLKGFTHYLKSDFDWFESKEGIRFFETANRLGLVASLALAPPWQPSLRKLARRFPQVPFLCHHMAGARAGEDPPHRDLTEILRSAEEPNIYIKMSGFSYVSQVSWDYPYLDTHWVIRELYGQFGPHRLCWGSDYPVVRASMTYRHALEAFRTHCSFIPDDDQNRILGNNLRGLLDRAGR